MVTGTDVAPPIGAWASILGHATVGELARGHSRVWSVRAEDGRAYVLKACGPVRPGPPLVDEYRVLLHLATAGVPVAVYQVTDDGTLSVERAGRSHLLLPRLPAGHRDHESGTDAPGACSRIGRRIGLLHRALADHPWPVRSYRHDMLRSLTESRAKLPAPVRERAVDRLAGRALSELDGLPVQRIHGDCGWGNVLVHDGDVTGFIDLDHLPIGPRVYDLGYYLASRIQAITAGSAGSERREAAFLSTAGRYVAGYAAVNPLSHREAAALPSAVLSAQLATTEWSHRLLTGLTGRALPDQAQRYRRGVAALTWIHDRFGDLAEALWRGSATG